MIEEPEPIEGNASDDQGIDLDDPNVQAWFKAHLPKLRRSASGSFFYRTLAAAFVLGLGAQIGGYELKSSSPGEPLGLIADLLYAFGWSLWTGCVVVLFLEVIPAVKQRQLQRAVRSYEASVREDAERTGQKAPEQGPQTREG
jgi:hypothetical protein